jgi:hypothetical protein
MTKPNMTNHKATAIEWKRLEDWVKNNESTSDSCLLELRSRIETLEEALAKVIVDNHKPTSNSKQIRSSLVDRVAQAMLEDESPNMYKGEATAAIREIVKWLWENKLHLSAGYLEQELQ